MLIFCTNGLIFCANGNNTIERTHKGAHTGAPLRNIDMMNISADDMDL